MKNELIRAAFTYFFPMVCVFAVLTMLNCFGAWTDDSDRDGWHRSGVRVITDQKTGLQYLSTWTGGITPRMNADGTQTRVKP